METSEGAVSSRSRGQTAKGGQQPFMWVEKHTPVLNDKELEQAQLPKPLYQEFFAEKNRLMQSVKGGSAQAAGLSGRSRFS